MAVLMIWLQWQGRLEGDFRSHLKATWTYSSVSRWQQGERMKIEKKKKVWLSISCQNLLSADAESKN